MNKAILKEICKYFFLLLLVCIPLFQYLGHLPVVLWDESRLAMNAYEMYQKGNYWVTTYNGEPDMWNTKPPLMIWSQVFFMKLFGVNELSIRLPSAFAALLICFLLIIISVKYIKNFWFGFICVLVLITSRGFVGYHASRTGDYDALLTLFLTLGNLSFFIFLENSKTKYLYLFFISLVLAFLTKSSAALLIIPGLFIYTAIQKKLILLLKNKHFYFGILIFFMSVGGYYYIREIYNPGYFKIVLENEFGGRFLNTLEQHKQNFWYYFKNLFDHRFIIWVFFIPYGIYADFKSKDNRIKNLTRFSSIVTLTFFIVISSAKTKLSWYVLPAYPFLSILVALSIYHIFLRIKMNEKLKHKIIPYIFLGIVFIFPYSQIVYKTCYKTEPKPNEEVYGICYYLRDILDGKIENDNFTIIYEDTFTHGQFYLKRLLEQGKNITLKNSNHINTGDILLISQNKTKEFVETHYQYNIIDRYQNAILYEIVDNKYL